MSCTYRNSILESDEFMRISYHSLSVIQVPLHALGFYIVIWKTPREMTSVKFSMLALHSACAFWDISWSILTIPVVFFPIVSGYPLGLLSYFGTPALFQTYLVFAGVYLLGCAIILFFEERYHRLVRIAADERSRKIKRIIHHVINIIIALIMFIPSILHIPDSQTARIISHQKLPCVPSRILDDPRMFMLSADPYDFHLYFALEMCSTAFQAIAFLIGTLNYLSKTKSLSKRTLQLQKQFFKCLCLQAMIPIVAIICPGIYIVYTAFTGNFDLVLGNFTTICLSSHGLFSTTAMLIVHKPYRQATINIFKRENLVRSNQISGF